MAAHTAEPSKPLARKERVREDEVANEVYAAHYAERKLSRLTIGVLTGTSLILAAVVAIDAHRPAVNRYIRIDEAGRAQAIQYSDLSYSPREGEIRTYLTDWAGYRYTVNRETMRTQYPKNYYFLSGPLASQLIREDNNSHLISQVLASQVEQAEVRVSNVTITSMTQEKIAEAIVSRGTALMTFDKMYSPLNSHEPRTEHWIASITYYLNPAQVNEHARTDPQYETINPLGLTITEFHENRTSVDRLPEEGSPMPKPIASAVQAITAPTRSSR